LRLFGETHGEPEVNDFHAAILSAPHVGWLDVEVCIADGVHVVQTKKQVENAGADAFDWKMM
jgi:hypothetical protein